MERAERSLASALRVHEEAIPKDDVRGVPGTLAGAWRVIHKEREAFRHLVNAVDELLVEIKERGTK
jgi:hypothetical protein